MEKVFDPMSNALTTYSSSALKEFSIQVFLYFGISRQDAEQAADVFKSF